MIDTTQFPPVPLFTPVETGNPFSSVAARYLSPLFCNREIAVFDPITIDNGIMLERCTRKEDDTSLGMTIVKIVSYILSAGILPLLAFVLNLIVRAGTHYWYITDNSEEERLLERDIRALDLSAKSNEQIEVELKNSIDIGLAMEGVLQKRYGQPRRQPFYRQTDPERYEAYKGLVTTYSVKPDEELRQTASEMHRHSMIHEIALERRRGNLPRTY